MDENLPKGWSRSLWGRDWAEYSCDDGKQNGSVSASAEDIDVVVNVNAQWTVYFCVPFEIMAALLRESGYEVTKKAEG